MFWCLHGCHSMYSASSYWVILYPYLWWVCACMVTNNPFICWYWWQGGWVCRCNIWLVLYLYCMSSFLQRQRLQSFAEYRTSCRNGRHSSTTSRLDEFNPVRTRPLRNGKQQWQPSACLGVSWFIFINPMPSACCAHTSTSYFRSM